MTDLWKTRLRWLGVGIVLAAATYVGASEYYQARVRAAQAAAEAASAHVDQLLREKGALEAKLAARPEEVVPALAGDAAEIRKAGGAVAAGVRIVTKEVPVEVPGVCGEPPSTGGATSPPHPPGLAGTPQILTSAAMQGIVVADPAGRFFVDGRIDVSQRVPGFPGVTTGLAIDQANSAVTLGKELDAAWRAYHAPIPWQVDLRLGFLAPDPGLTLGGTFFPTGHRLGGFLDVGYAYRSASNLGGYLSNRRGEVRGAAGVAFRFGPR